ncbi:MAG: hypothetical protein ACR2HA_08015 [Nocardioides sp.]
MDRARARFATALAVPGVALGVAGLFHPTSLGYPTAEAWTAVHLVGLFVFPLVGLALALLVHRRRDLVAWMVRLTAYGYATAYTALDVISGLAAGYVTGRIGPDQPRPEAVSFLFDVGGPLGTVGSWSLMLCGALLVLDALRRLGAAGAPGLLLLPGAYLVHADHIYPPAGAAGMALIGLATGWLAFTGSADSAGQPPQNSRWLGSSMPRSRS